MKLTLLSLSERLCSHPVFSWVRVTKSIGFCEVICRSFDLLFFVFDNCIICFSSIYDFLLPCLYISSNFFLKRYFQWPIKFDIINDSEFQFSNEMFKAVMVQLKTSGKANIQNKDADMPKLYSSDTQLKHPYNSRLAAQTFFWIKCTSLVVMEEKTYEK